MPKSSKVKSAARRRDYRTLTAILLLALLSQFSSAACVVAQTSLDQDIAPISTTKPPAAPEPNSKSQASETDADPIVIRGKRPLNKIDRQVYDVSKDPLHASETAADTLKKVSGVNVDANGDVSLRGNDVQILLNGKPSPLLAGDNRGPALRAMPSNMISSIEVMSNPGAQYGSSGAGGIINIVTKKINLPGSFGSFGGQVTSTGTIRFNGLMQVNKGRFSTNAFMNASEDRSAGSNILSQSEFDSNGDLIRRTSSSGSTDSFSRSIFLSGSADYDLGPSDTLTGSINVTDFSNRAKSSNKTSLYGSNAVLMDSYTALGLSRSENRVGSVGLSWTHLGRVLGENLKVDAKVTRTKNNAGGISLMDYSVVNHAPNNLERQLKTGATGDTTTVGLSSDYNTFIGDDQLSAGLQIDDEVSLSTAQFYDSVSLLPQLIINPILTSDFHYRQRISAAYLTYQKAFGENWAILAGLRIEDFAYASPEAKGGEIFEISYTNFNPSLFATYVISETSKFRLNYSRRLQRPTPWDLNPALKYINAQTVTIGTPALRPQEINSYELAYEYARNLTNYSARLYYLNIDRVINPVTTIIDDPSGAGNQVIQISRRNAGSTAQTGLQIIYASRFADKWFVNVSANIYNTQMHVPDIARVRSLVAGSSQLSLSYRPTNTDAISLSYNYSGRQLTGDGYTSGYAGGILSYNRNLSPTLVLTISANDILKRVENLYVRNTGTIRTISGSRQQAPTFYIGLSRRFTTGSFSALR